jgi:hypothetical protein
MNRYLLQTIKVAAIATVVLGTCLPPTAQAIPPNQRDVDFASFNQSAITTYQIIPNTSVTVNNGSTARHCIIQFSTEISAETVDRVRIHPIFDSTNANPTNCVLAGPEDVYTSATHAAIETRTVNWIRQLGAGTHTVRVCAQTLDLNLSGTASTNFHYRTLTIECRTQ